MRGQGFPDHGQFDIVFLRTMLFWFSELISSIVLPPHCRQFNALAAQVEPTPQAGDLFHKQCMKNLLSIVNRSTDTRDQAQA
jgi:hypothetical protein